MLAMRKTTIFYTKSSKNISIQNQREIKSQNITLLSDSKIDKKDHFLQKNKIFSKYQKTNKM